MVEEMLTFVLDMMSVFFSGKIRHCITLFKFNLCRKVRDIPAYINAFYDLSIPFGSS